MLMILVQRNPDKTFKCIHIYVITKNIQIQVQIFLYSNIKLKSRLSFNNFQIHRCIVISFDFSVLSLKFYHIFIKNEKNYRKKSNKNKDPFERIQKSHSSADISGPGRFN